MILHTFQTIVICNSGHMTGATLEDILNLFEKYGKIEDVTLVRDKAFCFITFSEIESAMNAFDDSNGKKSLRDSSNPMYMTYVNNIPEKFMNDQDQSLNEFPEGLEIHENFLSESEESDIIQSLTWNDDVGSLKKRQVQHFGKEFFYGSNTISCEDIQPIPKSWTEGFIQNSIHQGIQTRTPDQCTVNRYLPGQGIAPHIDNHNCCDDVIISLSLLSDVIMNFVDLDNPKSGQISVNLPRNSLMKMSGKSRYTFTHGIKESKSDVIKVQNGDKTTLSSRKRQERISLTFRKSIDQPCTCPFVKHCPSQNESIDEMTDETAAKLEKLHVHEVYEKIADHFSETRHKPWPKVLEFLSGNLASGAILADVGCGNGKYLGDQLENVHQIGFDYSQNLLKIVKRKGCQAVRSDALCIPIKDCAVDACISIAVIHHMSTKVIFDQITQIFDILKHPWKKYLKDLSTMLAKI